MGVCGWMHTFLYFRWASCHQAVEKIGSTRPFQEESLLSIDKYCTCKTFAILQILTLLFVVVCRDSLYYTVSTIYIYICFETFHSMCVYESSSYYDRFQWKHSCSIHLAVVYAVYVGSAWWVPRRGRSWSCCWLFPPFTSSFSAERGDLLPDVLFFVFFGFLFIGFVVRARSAGPAHIRVKFVASDAVCMRYFVEPAGGMIALTRARWAYRPNARFFWATPRPRNRTIHLGPGDTRRI